MDMVKNTETMQLGEELSWKEAPELKVEEVQDPNPKLTKRQQEKQEKEAKQYWNTMISRKEAYEMVGQAVMREQEKLQMIYVQIRTMADVLIEKGVLTEDELNERSKIVIEELFGANPTARDDYEKEKEEGKETDGLE
jgi:phage terminase large subunit GpA-like protein